MEKVNNNQVELNPNTGGAYSAGWDIMWKNFIALFVVFIIYSLLSGPVGIIQWKTEDFHWFLLPLVLFGIGFGIFVSGPIGYSANWVFLKAVRGEKFEVKDLFSVFQRNYWNAVLGNILVVVIVGMGIFMLIVPGIIFACRLAFVPYLIVDREMEVTEALSKSWEMTKGYGWDIFFMGLLAIPIGILGLLALIFGVIISAIWVKTSFAAMYQAVVEKEGYFQEAIVE
jgi:uncharacterized membrane protein